MARRQKLMREIQAVLRPTTEDNYFIRHTANGLFYRPEDYGQPLPGAEGKALSKRNAQVFKFGGTDVFF